MVLAAAVLVGVAALSLRSASPPARPLLGVSVNTVFNDPAVTPAGRETQLAAAQADGVRVARTDAFWEAAEPVPPRSGVHAYDWSFADRVATGLAIHGMQWLALIDYTPTWARAGSSEPHAPPASNADYAAYAAAFARRYGRDGNFWRAHPEVPYRPVSTYEIWNEPDSAPFWRPRPDPVAYADLYLAARRALHAVDPRAEVVVGGLVPDSAYVAGMYRARPELRRLVDGVALHPYGADPGRVFGHVRELRATLRGLGQRDVPILVTEYGWQSVAANGVQFASVADKAAFIERATDVLARSDCGIAAVVLYSWITSERDRGSADDWYGVYRPQGGDTPSSRALARVLHRSAKGSEEARICS